MSSNECCEFVWRSSSHEQATIEIGPEHCQACVEEIHGFALNKGARLIPRRVALRRQMVRENH